MSMVGESSRGVVRSMSHRVGVDFDEASKKKTVRRAEGNRAGSEASASIRGRSTQPIGTDYKSLSVGRPNAPPKTQPFSTVRKIFRSRSKSVSMPSRPSTTPDTIAEVDEFGRTDVQMSSPAPSEPARERKTSFFSRRSKTPPQPKVDLEGVDVQAKRGPMQREFVTIVQSPDSARRESVDTLKSRSTPATTPPAKEPTSSDSRGGIPFGSLRSANTDRSLTLQAIESASPYGSRRNSPAFLSRNNNEQGGSSQEDTRLLTPTPAKHDLNGYPEIDEGTGVAYSTATPSTKGTPTVPRASVPKIWQDLRNLRNGEGEEVQLTPTYGHTGRQVASSATSGSMSSYRTARSTIPPPKSPNKVSQSPLSDLIFNLEQRLSSSRYDYSPGISGYTPALAAGPDTPPVSSGAYIPPFQTIRRLEDDGESLQSSSSSSYTANRWTGNPTNPVQQDVNLTPMARRSGVGDMSMSEIEDSVAAVEAALQDHSIEGSFDPSNLRRKIIPPRHASMMGQEGVTEEEIDEFEILSQHSPGIRIRLPLAQEVAIADAVKQVRRALSSSQLPQIPNEDESMSDHSHQLALPQSHAVESTPMRAARVRQESMQDVEEAYARMVDLVGSAAGIDLNALSPMPNFASVSDRQSNQSKQQQPFTSSGSGNLTYPSPGPSAAHSPSTRYSHGRTQSAVPVPSSIQSHSSTASRAARQQLLRESDILARLNQTPRETDEPVLRGRVSNMSLGSRRAISESPPRHRLDSSNVRTMNSPVQNQQAQLQQQLLLQQQKAKAKRVSIEQPAGSSAHGSGAGTALGTSPSATIKTQGTPRSIELDQYSHPNAPSHAQQIYDWNRSRYSSSPSSVRPMVSMMQDKLASVGSGADSSSNQYSGIDARMMEEQRRRNRGGQYLNGSMLPSSPTQATTASRRDEWSHVGEAMQRPQSGESNYNNALLAHKLPSMREFNGEAGSPTLALQKRHALERDSLLDMLERSRNEASALRARKVELEADLHQEVTRVLELQREINRQRENEQTLRQNEQVMRERISTLEAELKHEHDDRNRIAELLERVQQAVDNATKVDADQDGWTSVRPTTFHDHNGFDSSAVASETHTEQRSPSLRSYPSALGLAMDDKELSWSLDQEEPLEESEVTSTSSHGFHKREEAIKQAASPSTTPDKTAIMPAVFTPPQTVSKRFSQSAVSSRLPLPSSTTNRSPMIGSSQVFPSTSNTSTVVPSATLMTSMDGITPSRIPTSSPIANRTSSLADRMGGSLIGKPRKLSGPSSITSSSPQSLRNMSTSSSAGASAAGYGSLRFGLSPARKVSAASRMTNTTGGDTSYTARTPEQVDVTTLDDLGNDSSSFI